MTSSWRHVPYLAPLTAVIVASASFIVLTLVSTSIWAAVWTKIDFIEHGIHVKERDFFKNAESFSQSSRQDTSSRESGDRSAIIRALESLLHPNNPPNPTTLHIRISDIVQNVSMTPPDGIAASRQTFNPTIMALPYWSPNQYLLVSRVVTEGLHQENLICEANTCYARGAEGRRPGEKDCNDDDIMALGAAGGLRCAHDPIVLNIPPTPSEKCTGKFAAFPDIPGFHDPRIFWSGKGEPLIVINSHSRYACFGLWITDLRNLHTPLATLLSSMQDGSSVTAPLISYPFLTELTRNPRTTRSSVEKNWFLFFPSVSASYVHYDLSWSSRSFVSEGNLSSEEMPTGGRSFAKLIGNGFTTPNLTSPEEAPCLPQKYDPLNRKGRWHQASNSLKLILCRREEAHTGSCSPREGPKNVHFALIHRKFSNEWALPLRYERYFVVWDTAAPFNMLGMSQYPVQLWNETASGWNSQENWNSAQEEGELPSPHNKGKTHGWLVTHKAKGRSIPYSNHTVDSEGQEKGDANSKDNWAYFTYTPSIAWAWRPRSERRRRTTDTEDQVLGDSENPLIDDSLTGLQVGFLDDEVILGIGIDDKEQAFGRVKAETLLQGLRLCPTSRTQMPKLNTELGVGSLRSKAEEVPVGMHSMEQTAVNSEQGRSAMTSEGLHGPEEKDQKKMLDLEHDGF